MDNDRFERGLKLSVYGGAPQALECFRVARKVLESDGAL